ncbi:pectate lyase, family PL1 [Zobellia galactanivorans]|uniref:Pectate lyase, family PL1 n=1 Tax=Zobellia galactanivorans (strain DSM 12802 / CCUG 47099 / CIP 106680 / NCIMB 13871 / Dsij) TaxID=63186 RepID=G0L835_ZOBGA|nr:pectate lyase, family PL1 [Zobellia galactanivorans]CAZ97912.1 Pectate lyase, family PL1 [Zobellia galactanivorans]
MNFSHPTSKRITLSLLSTLTLFSCSKDTELLESYLDASAPTNESPLGVNDFYKVGENGRITMDVLSNDRFSNPNNVKIIGVSEPKNGYVVINDDNTITYVLGDRSAQEEAEAAEAERKAREKEEAQALQEQAQVEAEEEAKAQAEREAQEKAEAEAKAQAEREAQEKAEAEAKAQAEREAQEKTEAEAQAQAEREAQEKAEAEAKAQAEREAQEKAEAEAKAQAEREAQEKAEAEAKAQAEKEAQEKAAAEAAAQEEVDDSFTYTTETTDEEGNVVTEEVNVTVTTKAFSELKAFPTAEGFGKNATGGRGGIVVEVTNLNDSGPGSLRAALEMKQTRTIVFKVGGTIKAKSHLPIYPGSENVTIAGQTAPGDGILIKGGELRIGTGNVIVRHLRIRMGDNGNDDDNSDGIKIKSFEPNGLKDVIIDHCSISWADDENISISNAKNITVQNSVIGESVRAVLMGDSKNVSFINNLFALNNSRNIMAGSVEHKDLTFEQINNIVYGFKWATAGTEGMTFNAIGNKYKLSKDFKTSTEYAITLSPPAIERSNTNRIETTRAYLKDNIIDTELLGVYRWEIKPYLISSPVNKSDYKATNASSLDDKLLPRVGASVPKRDAVDSRLINHYKNGSGSLKSNGSFPSINNGTAYKDSDKDGMSDDWEKAHGLNPNDKNDGNKDRNGDGYTNLEDFLYYLANN